MARTNLNRDGESQNYKKAVDDGKLPIQLNDIYKSFQKYCKENNIPMVLTMSDMSYILKAGRVRNTEWHHHGTEWFAREVYFSSIPREDISITMTRIVRKLLVFNNDVLAGGDRVNRAQASIKKSFETKILNLFTGRKRGNFYKELHKLIKEYRYDFERLEILNILAVHKYSITDPNIMKFAEKKDYLEELIKEISPEMDAKDFAKYFSLNQEMRKKLMKNFKRNMLSLEYLGSGLADSLKETYNDILNEGLNSKEIERAIKSNLKRKLRKGIYESTNSYNNKVKTLSRTFSHGIDNLINFNSAVGAGLKHFKYVGSPAPERDFCIKHINKIYDIDTINGLDNGQGLDVMTYGGGYNCRHFWLPVDK